MDEPTADPAILTSYLVCKEAAKDVTVLLSGVGGDEIFAGYRKYAADSWARLCSMAPHALTNFARNVSSGIPNLRGSRFKGPVRLMKKMLRSSALDPRSRFIANCTYLDSDQRSGVYTDALRSQVWEYESDGCHQKDFDIVQHADFLNQMLYLDTKIFMTSLNLTYNDKMSMACSVEVRVPFLNRELAEFVAWNVPPHLKLKGCFFPTTKHILRKAMRGILPEEVLSQPKAGFAAPTDYWLANDLLEMTDDLLSAERIRNRGLFRPEKIQQLISEHRSGRQDWAMQIWQFLTLELWMQNFLDGSTRWRECENAQAAIA
jgi:asparagine synthase (glutamine-hydrolysing)